MLALSVVLNGSEAVIAGTVCPLNEKKKKIAGNEAGGIP